MYIHINVSKQCLYFMSLNIYIYTIYSIIVSYNIICLCEPSATDKYQICVDDVMAILV